MGRRRSVWRHGCPRVGVTLVRPSPVRAPPGGDCGPEIAFGSDSFAASLPPPPALRPLPAQFGIMKHQLEGREIGGPGQGCTSVVQGALF